MTTTAHQQDSPRRTALVTGGSNGMGRAIAQRFPERGYEVRATGQAGFDQTMTVDLKGPFFAAQRLAPVVRAGGRSC